MTRLYGRLGATVAVAIVVAAASTRAQVPTTARHGRTPQFTIPASLRAEHAEIHAELARATRVPGRVGDVARGLAGILEPHFVREEQIALPPLGLLAPLSRGQYTSEMRAVLPLTDSLRAELPHMLREHAAIRAATLRLERAAREAGNARAVRLAERLKAHALSEEEVTYPAAVLVGDLVRARTVVSAVPR